MNENQKKILSLFSVLLLVLSLFPLASAANVAVWNEWMIGGEGIGDYQLTVNKGSSVQFYVFVDAFSNFDLDVGLYNNNNQLVYTFDSVDNYNSFYDEYTYNANTVGTFYVRSVATSGSSVSTDEIKLVVSCVDTDGDGVCNTDEVPGCTDVNANNYNPLATNDNGSCTYTPADVSGCMDDEALNYNPDATEEDGSCEYNHAPNFQLNPKADRATWFLFLPLIPTYDLEEGNGLAVNVIGTDEDNDQLSFEFEGVFGDLPDWMHFYDNGDNTATIALVSSEVGSYSVKVTVIDEHGASFYWPVLFEVTEESVVILGCTDVAADNYNPLATDNDGSCEYACVDTDGDGVCDEDEVAGCTDLTAENYNPLATDDDGSCEYACVDTDGDGVCDEDEVTGCTDVAADNYNPLATDDDGSCEYACVDTDGDGVCDVDEVLGCTDLTAENYNPLATDDDGSCEYACVDTDGDGVCDEDEVAGCTDLTAENYNPLATDDDGSCEYACVDTDGDGVCDVDEVLGCTDLTAENYNALATVDDGSCVYGPGNQPPQLIISGMAEVYEGEELTFNVYVNDETLNAADITAYAEECLIGRFICYNTNLPVGVGFNVVGEDGTLTWTPDYTFVTHPDLTEEITFVFVVDDGEFVVEQEVTIKVIDVNRVPDLDVQTNEPFAENQEVQIDVIGSDADAEDNLDYEINNVPSWLTVDINGDSVSISGVPSCNAAGLYEVEITVTDGIDSMTEVVVLNIAEACDLPVEGCTDPNAFNYNANANVDDGSCEAIVSGCTDVDAFNYNADANVDDGSCEAIVSGCTDSEAANYNPNANVDDGSCVCVDLDNDGICDFEDTCVDQDNDGFCDYKDACPLEAEDFDNYLDEDGCPESHEDANIASVHLSSETAVPGDYLSMYIKMSNNGDTYFGGMRAEAIVYDWGQKAATGEFNLQPGQEKGRNLVMQVPYDTPPGDYLIKVILKNDYYHESMYRLVTIY